MEFIPMYLKDSVSVKELNDKKNDFLFLKSNRLKTKYFIVVSHKKNISLHQLLQECLNYSERYERQEFAESLKYPHCSKAFSMLYGWLHSQS